MVENVVRKPRYSEAVYWNYDEFFFFFFQICSTYPNVLVVPKSIDDETIICSAKFRDGGRFPVLSFRHSTGVSML